MEMSGEKLIKKAKKTPMGVIIGYLICLIAIIGATFSMEYRIENCTPDAINFTTDGAFGMAENQYAYLEVQGLTDEVAIYGDTENRNSSTNDRYYIALNDGYWYVVDLNFETIDKLKDIQDYTYSTDENAVAPTPVTIYGITEKVPTELQKMLVDFYNEGIEDEYKISLDEFEKYFGSVLLNVRKDAVDTFIEEIIILIAGVAIFVIFISHIANAISKNRVKKYIKKNEYEAELVNQLDDFVEEKHYKDKVILTKDFFVDTQNGGFTAFKFSDVKWVHIHNVKYYGTITVSSSIIVHLKDGKTNLQCLTIRRDVTDEFMGIFNKICEKVPEDCLKGFTQENQKEFKKYKKEIKRNKVN